MIPVVREKMERKANLIELFGRELAAQGGTDSGHNCAQKRTPVIHGQACEHYSCDCLVLVPAKHIRLSHRLGKGRNKGFESSLGFTHAFVVAEFQEQEQKGFFGSL